MKNYEELLRAAKAVLEIKPECYETEYDKMAFIKLEEAIKESAHEFELLRKSRAMIVPLPGDIREVSIVTTLIKEFNPGVVVISSPPSPKIEPTYVKRT